MLIKKIAIGTAVAAMFFFGAGSAALAADVTPAAGDCTISIDENGNKVQDCVQVDPPVDPAVDPAATDGSTDGSTDITAYGSGDGSTDGTTDGSVGEPTTDPVDVPAEPDVTLIYPGQPCTTSTDGDGNEIQICPRVMYDKAGGGRPIAYNFRGATGATTEDPTPAPTPELVDAPIACGYVTGDGSTDTSSDPATGCVNPTMYKDANTDANCSSTTDADGNTQTVCPDTLMYASGLATGVDGNNIYDSGVFGGSAAAVVIAVVASTVLLRKRNA